MKKLYRVNDNKKIAGICGGIGEIFSIDPTIVRLIFIFACVLTQVFPLVVTYAIGWLIIPEKSEIEMQENNREDTVV
jgi:phage shock protein C